MYKKFILFPALLLLFLAPITIQAFNLPKFPDLQPGDTRCFDKQGARVACKNVVVGDWILFLIDNIFTVILWPLFGVAAIIMLIYSGVKFLNAKGDPMSVKEARNALMWAIVGIALAVLAFSIPGIINSVLFP